MKSSATESRINSGQLDKRLFNACMEESVACALQCEACISTCIGKEYLPCINICRDCAAMNLTLGKLLARNSEFAVSLMNLCYEVCTACSVECEKHYIESCRHCAKICRHTAQKYREMLEKYELR